MRKTEIKPLIPLIFCRRKIVLFLLLCHCIPDLIPLRVDPHIEDLCANKDKDIIHSYSNEYFITAAVQGLVVVAIDLRPLAKPAS